MLELLKRPDTQGDLQIFTIPDDGEGNSSERICCPLCEWIPTPASAWCCFSE